MQTSDGTSIVEHLTRPLLPALALLLTACSYVGVVPEGPHSIRPARPAECDIEFIRGPSPDRPYDKVAVIMWESVWYGEATAIEEIRRQACALGADAVIMNREYVAYAGNPGQVIATAIKFRRLPATTEPPVPAGNAVAAAPTAECPRTLTLPARLAPREGRVLMLGEWHGTNELPRLAGDLLCAVAGSGLETRLGLEMPWTDQDRIDAFLHSDGGLAARDALLSGSKLWGFNDGRSSTAVYDLLDRARLMVLRGVKVSVFAFDITASDGWDGRDGKMAAAVAKDLSAHPSAAYVISVGNFHARTARPSDASTPPLMGGALKARGLDIFSLDWAGPAGSAWYRNPAGQTGVGPVGPYNMSKAGQLEAGQVIELFEAPSPQGFDGLYHASALTPALPMQMAAAQKQ